MLLIGLSDNFRRRGYAADRFRLPMTRTDIANHLGLVPETMSRLFARLGRRGLMVVEGREVRLTDVEGLRQMAHMVATYREGLREATTAETA
ncbi:MAG TPA: helix-turn-helix domain-containing protein [Gammaproteobacteria bacterium]|nr:helix-turn-helix domain-containing protein [Gammaproteobacteria bacterium]